MRRAIVCAALFLTATVVPAGAQQLKLQWGISLGFPGKSWAVAIDSPGFVVQQKERKADGREYLFATNSETGLGLSIMLEQSKGGADATSCPAYLKNRVDSITQFEVTGVKTSEVASMPVIEYLVPKVKEVPVRQENVIACAAKDDIYIDIHLSKAGFKPSDESLFTNILNEVHFAYLPGDASAPLSSEPPPAPSGASSLAYFSEGSRRYIVNDFKGAIGPYQKALDLEKVQPELSKNYWRVLVDNLGMAYGITGDLDSSEATLQYGLSKDPDYPMFYYNLGCVYAERGDMDKTIGYLGSAFARKGNSIPGEGIPDPHKDDSFRRFMSNERFRKFVDSLTAGN